MVRMYLDETQRYQIETHDGKEFAVWDDDGHFIRFTRDQIIQLEKLTMPAQAAKLVKKSKYDDWRTQFERVPVQYGNFSKQPRLVVHLAFIGSMPAQIENYYRITDSERGGGRFFVVRRWNDLDEEAQKEVTFQRAYYLSYRELPQELRQHIESGATKTFYSKLADDEERDDGTMDPNPETFEREGRE